MAFAHGIGITPHVWHWWLAIGLLVVAAVACVWEALRPRSRRTPDAVKAVQARHAAPDPASPAVPVDDVPAADPVTPEDPPEPIDDVPPPAAHSRDIFGRVGADASWAAELAAIPAGELTPLGIPTVSIDQISDEDLIRPGTPTVSIDDFTDEELWEASFGADLRRLDNKLEEARRLCTRNLVAAGLPLDVMQAIDLRDADSHARAIDGATVLITMEIQPLSRRPHRLTVAQARRQRHRDRKAGVQ